LTQPASSVAVPAARAGTAPPYEQTRARYPEAAGYVVRDGVRVFYEVYGSDESTILLLPTWSIVHSRSWKLQIPYLSRHFRVVTFDGRGNGRSDRPEGAAAYATTEFAADALAVLDAAEVESAALVCLSCGALWATLVAADHPARTDGVVYICPAVALAPGHPERAVSFEDALDTDEGWAKYNRHYWKRDFVGFLEFFFGKCFNEPHSTKQIEDCIGWALETTPQTLADAGYGIAIARKEKFRDTCKRVRCPTLVIHGDSDQVRPHAQGAALARQTAGELVTLRGSGHMPLARDPVKINLLIREFVDSLRR
jgi:pimeloyl-ACP methyl ester carboxylesterase